ncbi:hypothetical protein BBP40_001358 [Aspergillus hancockii]|nr:hypothetical protein BBP40_001358 [Aspergillus hancockii]
MQAILYLPCSIRLAGAAKTPNQLIVFRFLAGLGAAGPYGIGRGMNSDLFQAHERGKALAVFTLALLVGTAIGPIAGGFLAQNIGAATYSGATVVQLVCVQGYLIDTYHDTYQRYAASAMASVMVPRNLLGFALPLVAPNLYGNLDFAWGNTLLACVAVVIGIPAPLLL